MGFVPLIAVLPVRTMTRVASCCSDADLVESLIGWCARPGLQQMYEFAWRWQSRHLQGYAAETAEG